MKKETVKKINKTQKKETEVIKTETNDKVETVKSLTLAEQAAERFKEIYKEVYITKIAGEEIVWRKLKRSEYKEAMSIKFDENEDINYFERQDYMAKKVILYPENVDLLLEEYAGISDIIATETMVKTGFGIANTKAVK